MWFRKAQLPGKLLKVEHVVNRVLEQTQ